MQNQQRPFTFANRESQLAGKINDAKARAPFLWLLSPIVIIAVYLVDLWMPVDLTIPICSVATLVLLVAVADGREKLLIAGVCTTLMLSDFFLQASNPTGPAWGQAVSHGLAIVMIWSVTTLGLRHNRVEQSLRDNQRIANKRLALIDTIYASAPVGLCFLDRELRYVSVNNALAEMDGHPPDFYPGKSVREAVPELAAVIEAYHRRVIESGHPVVDVEVIGTTQARPNEQRYWLSSYYPVCNDSGDLLGVNVAVRDVTRRKHAEANALFLLDVGDCIRVAADGDELLWAVSVALGEHLRASRCLFIRIDGAQDRVVVQRDYHPHMQSLVGHHSLSALPPAIVAAGRLGQTIVVGDVSRDQRTAEFVDAHRELGVSAFVAAPLVRDGQLTSAIVVATAESHEWHEREVALVNLVAERTWEAVEKLQLDAALRVSDAALRDADRRKDEFLATLAHELRNPLSLMRNVVTLQQTSGTPHSDPQWGRDIIERQVNYLTRLTDDLFDVSRITREKLDLQKETLNLPEVIQAAIESCRPLIEQRRHELIVTMAPESVYVDADRVRLTQVFMNLLNNAAKYTPDPGHIWLNVEPAGDTVEVRVKDTGLGIAPQDLPRLFELFYQVDRSFTRSEGGLGLGLTLVHRLVELHGGKVEARSAGVDRGSEFIVRLPVLQISSHAVEPALVQQNGAHAPTRCRRILVADDFPQSAETLAQLLRHEGYEVRVAQDGIEAFQTAAEFRPDVIVLDIAMPKLNGYEAARKIREQPWGRDILLIALTGWGQQQDRRRTQEAGFNAHLTKPVNYNAIAELLANVPGTEISGASQNLTQ